MDQDRFKGRVFQWIKGDNEGQAEFVLESRDGKLIFDSGNTIYIRELKEFMVEMGVPGMETLRIDPITGGTAVNNEIPGLNTPIDPPAAIPEPQPIGEEAIIMNLLEKQKKSSHLSFDVRLRIPVPTQEAYEFLSSTFDSDVIAQAIIRKAQKDIDIQLKEAAEKLRADLIPGIELKYGTDGNVRIEEATEGVRALSESHGPEGLQGVEVREGRKG